MNAGQAGDRTGDFPPAGAAGAGSPSQAAAVLHLRCTEERMALRMRAWEIAHNVKKAADARVRSSPAGVKNCIHIWPLASARWSAVRGTTDWGQPVYVSEMLGVDPVMQREWAYRSGTTVRI